MHDGNSVAIETKGLESTSSGEVGDCFLLDTLVPLTCSKVLADSVQQAT